MCLGQIPIKEADCQEKALLGGELELEVNLYQPINQDGAHTAIYLILQVHVVWDGLLVV